MALESSDCSGMNPDGKKLGLCVVVPQVCLRKSGKQETELGSDTVKGPSWWQSAANTLQITLEALN